MKKLELKLLLASTALFTLLIAVIFWYRSTPRSLNPSENAGNTASSQKYSSKAFVNGKLNINGAAVEDLMLLPGIGQTLAERIVEYRQQNGPYTNILELLLVEGFGQTRLEEITEYITIGG